NTVRPLAFTSASSRFMVSSGPKALLMVISPSAAIARTPNKNHVAAINTKAASLVGGLTTLTISFLSARPGWPELRLRNKTVAILHLDVWQTCLVELAVGGKDAVEAQDVGGDGIGLARVERVDPDDFHRGHETLLGFASIQ